MGEYTFKQKKKLMSKIEKIKKEKYLIAIMNIIKDDPKCKDGTECDDGVFLYFHNLEDETYNKIDEYIKDLKKHKKLVQTSESDVISDYTPYSYQDGMELNAKLRLNNQEKSILKRKQYETEISNDNNVYETLDISKYTDTEIVSSASNKSNKKQKANKNSKKNE